ncbi:MAG: tRNA (N(6)-L-threonylcarbamoyladenosine(37)-C(2))-methylthiotransferase MtaB [Syntrophobacteraceae bacterium]|nr:tRNA (N(6)-L-threonylcarbamoyladenosine(37)-C(2))-methylthiotransferase MtaB [Desulfobacteraceae bacterium]
MSIKVALETLGCKVNQYESSHFLETLCNAGFEPVSFRDPADVYIVHSCAVTSRACYQTRQMLRRAQRLNPEAVIVVAGCNAQLEPDRLARERLATHILGNREKFDLLHWLRQPGGLAAPCLAISDPRSFGECPPTPVGRMHSGRIRAFLKIQDGCNAFCSYCVVPYTRGRSRSLPREAVREQMDLLLLHGYPEVVLTGIHLGQWGKDLDPPQGFADLLEYLARGDMPRQVRLSSLESTEIGGDLLRRMTSWPWLCPHFHVPLQSGDEEILKLMNRPYSPAQYAEVVEELHRLFPDAALGADVLVGFPGETERQFQNTFRFISRLPLTYLHVFPYSPRPGTRAAALPGRVTGDALKQRARALQILGEQKKQAFRERFLGREVEVIAESREPGGLWQGTSGNYLQVFFPAPPDLPQGTAVRIHPVKSGPKGLFGEMISIVT